MESVQTGSTKKSTTGLRVHDNWRCSTIFPFLVGSLRRTRRGASWRAGVWEGEAGRRCPCEDGSIQAPSEATWMQDVCMWETTPMLFGLSFSEDFFLVSEIWLRIACGCLTPGTHVVFFFWWACGLQGHPSGSRQVYGLLIARQTSLTFIQLRLKTEGGRTKIPLAAESKQDTRSNPIHTL